MDRTQYPYKNDFKTDNCLTDTMKIKDMINSNDNIINLPSSAGTLGTTQQITQSVSCIVNTKIIYLSLSFTGTIRYQNGTGITNISISPAGLITITIQNDFYSQKPIVVGKIGASSPNNLYSTANFNYVSSSTTSIILYTIINGALSSADIDLLIIGQG